MTADTKVAKAAMTCSEFQDRLPELYESGEELNGLDHLQTCENCAALVSDLNAIVDAAKIMLPLHDPDPSVWRNIQSKLQDSSGN